MLVWLPTHPGSEGADLCTLVFDPLRMTLALGFLHEILRELGSDEAYPFLLSWVSPRRHPVSEKSCFIPTCTFCFSGSMAKSRIHLFSVQEHWLLALPYLILQTTLHLSSRPREVS